MVQTGRITKDTTAAATATTTTTTKMQPKRYRLSVPPPLLPLTVYLQRLVEVQQTSVPQRICQRLHIFRDQLRPCGRDGWVVEIPLHFLLYVRSFARDKDK